MPVSTQQSTSLEVLLGDPTNLDRAQLAVRMQAIDPDLWRHASVVAGYVDVMIAFLPRQNSVERDRIVDAAWLHDLGKLTMGSEILLRPGPLTDSEWTEMRGHPSRGADYMERSEQLRDSALLVRQHHEWHDGGGYPSALRGAQIEFGACLIGVADAYDAMTSWRPYRPMLSDDEAVTELKRCAESQFAPEIVDLFIRSTEGRRARITR